MDDVFGKLQMVKVSLFTSGQKEKSPKSVQFAPEFSLSPEGGVV